MHPESLKITISISCGGEARLEVREAPLFLDLLKERIESGLMSNYTAEVTNFKRGPSILTIRSIWEPPEVSD